MRNTITHPDVEQVAEKLRGLPTSELREMFAEYYHYTPRSRNRPHLISKILWAIQRDAHGDISAAVRKRALRIADDRDVRERFRRPSSSSTTIALGRKPAFPPGTVFIRHYKGTEYRVLVLENGFEHDGRWFKSLSAIARQITGTQWNGKLFFKVKEGTR